MPTRSEIATVLTDPLIRLGVLCLGWPAEVVETARRLTVAENGASSPD